MMIIGLTGYAGSGKSTVAEHLTKTLTFQRHKFAGPLKNMLRSMLHDQGASHNQIERMIEGDLKEVPSQMLGGQTPRHAMQCLGTEWGRVRLDPEVWVTAAMNGALNSLRDANVVFDDVRFENEAAAIRATGGVIVRLERPGCGPVNGHVSEIGVVPDVVIQNDEWVGVVCKRMQSAVMRHRLLRTIPSNA